MASMDMLPDDLVLQIIADHDAAKEAPMERDDDTYHDHEYQHEPEKLTVEQKRELIIQGNPEAALRDALERSDEVARVHDEVVYEPRKVAVDPEVDAALRLLPYMTHRDPDDETTFGS